MERMAGYLDELRNNSAAQFEKVRWAMSNEEKKATHSRIDYFVQKSLRRGGKRKDVEKLKSCRRGAYCGNIYCGVCRDRKASNLLGRVRAHLVAQRMGEDACRERLRWITVLHSLERAEIAEIKEATKRARADCVQLNRRFKGSWARGAFEYELVDMEKVHSRITKDAEGSRKKVTLQKLGGYEASIDNLDHSWRWKDKAGNQRTDYVLVHTHFLMDCGTEDWATIEKDMKRRWYKDYQVEVDGLYDYEVRSLEDSLWKMSSYCFKNRCSHHYKFGKYDIDEYEVDENMFSVNELNTIYSIYKSIAGGRNTGLLLGWRMKH